MMNVNIRAHCNMLPETILIISLFLYIMVREEK
jgi:hypothetical protein